ncbi:hypothetical protein [Tolypothrix tenuis]
MQEVQLTRSQFDKKELFIESGGKLHPLVGGRGCSLRRLGHRA